MRQHPLPRRITVMVVEDHPEFRDTLSRVVSDSEDMRLLGACKDLPAGLCLLEQQCPDVLLVDLGLPSGSGMVLLRSAKILWGARCTTALLTVTGIDEHLLMAAAAGAKGYLFKSDQAADWLGTIRALAMGQSPLHAKLAHSFLQQFSARAGAADADNGSEGASLPWVLDVQTHALLLHIAAGYTSAEAALRLNLSEADTGRRIRAVYDQFFQPGPCLSPRELELMGLLNKGYTFKKCAELMGVSESTTKTQAARAYEKLGASNLQMALYEARQAGLIA